MKKSNLSRVVFPAVLLSSLLGACMFSTDSTGGESLTQNFDFNSPIETQTIAISPTLGAQVNHSQVIVHSFSSVVAKGYENDFGYSEYPMMLAGTFADAELKSYIKFNVNDSLATVISGTDTLRYPSIYKDSLPVRSLLKPSLVLSLDSAYYKSTQWAKVAKLTEDLEVSIRWKIDSVASMNTLRSAAEEVQFVTAFRNDSNYRFISDTAFSTHVTQVLNNKILFDDSIVNQKVVVSYTNPTTGYPQLTIPMDDEKLIQALTKKSNYQTLTLEVSIKGSAMPLRLSSAFQLHKPTLNLGLVSRYALQSAHVAFMKRDTATSTKTLYGEIGDSLSIQLSPQQIRTALGIQLDSNVTYGQKGVYRALLGFAVNKGSFVSEFGGRYSLQAISFDTSTNSQAYNKYYNPSNSLEQNFNYIDYATDTLFIDVTQQVQKMLNFGSNQIGRISLNLGRAYFDSTANYIVKTTYDPSTQSHKSNQNFLLNTPSLSKLTLINSTAHLKLQLLPYARSGAK